jgi:hypothetical protein
MDNLLQRVDLGESDRAADGLRGWLFYTGGKFFYVFVIRPLYLSLRAEELLKRWVVAERL